eukprot:scaffold4066_cov417-Prasinococcus_capsulatus_cf.AAC.17
MVMRRRLGTDAERKASILEVHSSHADARGAEYRGKLPVRELNVTAHTFLGGCEQAARRDLRAPPLTTCGPAARVGSERRPDR